MFTIIGIIVLGVLTGYILKNRLNSKSISKIILIIICILLLVLGVTVGSNPQIVNNIFSLGATAFIITIASMLCSALVALFIYKKILNSKEDER